MDTTDIAVAVYDKADAPVYHALLRRISNGDVIYLKSFTPQAGLTIKAVGIVTDDTVYEPPGDLGSGVKVRWTWMARATPPTCNSPGTWTASLLVSSCPTTF